MRARQKSDETMLVGIKRCAAKVLLPEHAGPHNTSKVLGGTFMIMDISSFLDVHLLMDSDADGLLYYLITSITSPPERVPERVSLPERMAVPTLTGVALLIAICA